MKFKIISAKLTGNPDDSGWVQVHDFTPESGEKRTLRGRLFAVVSIRGLDTQQSAKRELLEQLDEEYYEANMEANAHDALKESLAKVSESAYQNGVECEIVAGAYVDGTFYMALTGGTQVSIYRDGNYATLVRGANGVTTASGEPRDGDIITLSTSGFIERVDEHSIESAFSEKNPEHAVEVFAPLVHTNPNQGMIGLLVLGFEEKETVTETPAVKPLLDQLTSALETDETEDEPRTIRFTEPTSPPLSRSPFKGSGLGKSFLKRKLYIRRGEVDVEEARKRKTAATAGFVLLVLLVLSIVFGVRQRSLKSAQAEFDAKITSAEHKIEEAKSLFVLNPERSRELFAESKSIIDAAAELRPEDSKVKDLLAQYENGKMSVLGEHDESAEEFVDLSLIDGFEGGFLRSTTDDIYIYDKGKNRIVEVSINPKKTEVVVGPAKLQSPEDVAVYAGRIFVLEEDGVYQVGDTREKVLEKDWEGMPLIGTYGGNLYTLNRNSSEIRRRPGSDEGFGSGSSWLAPGITLDLSKVISWSIDGTIWILTSSGHVERFSFGVPSSLKDLQVVPALENPSEIYTNEELQNVYILDPATRRVAVFDKEGNYKAQHKAEIIGEAIGFSVSEKQGKIIILTKDKLYSIGL